MPILSDLKQSQNLERLLLKQLWCEWICIMQTLTFPQRNVGSYWRPLVGLLLLPEDDIVVKSTRGQDIPELWVRPSYFKDWSLVSYEICMVI